MLGVFIIYQMGVKYNIDMGCRFVCHPHADTIRGAVGCIYRIILFPLWDHSLITRWGSKPGRGSNNFGPLEDQQCLTSIRKSELLTLNEKNVPIGGSTICGPPCV